MFKGKSHELAKAKVEAPLSRPGPKVETAQRIPANPLWHRLASRVQPRLTVGAPNDPYEHEADRIADQVMRMPDPAATDAPGAIAATRSLTPQLGRTCAAGKEEQDEKPEAKPMGVPPSTLADGGEAPPLVQMSSTTTPIVHRKCDACDVAGATCPKCEEEQTVRRKEVQGAPNITSPVHARIDALRGGGAALPRSVRAFFEPRFGRDLSEVRVHTDSRAAELAKAIHAKAFTIGHDVVFDAQQYAPDTASGRYLLSHELVHVLQQTRSTPGLDRVARQEDKNPPAKPGDAPLPAGVLPGSGPIKRPPPAAGNETISFEGVLLSVDAGFDRWQLEQLIATSGEGNAQAFVDRLSKAPEEDDKRLEANKKLAQDTKKYPGDVSGAPLPASTVTETEERIRNKERTKKVIQTAKSEHDKLVAENREFLAAFETMASGDLIAMLRESKSRVTAEAAHYGIPADIFRSTIRTQAFPTPKTPFDVRQSDRANKADEEYARRTEAAAVEPRKKLVDAAKALQKKREEVVKLRAQSTSAKPGQIFPEPKTAIDVLPLVKAEGEYAALRREKELEFPILAAYAQEGGDLNVIIRAGAPDGDLKKVIADEIREKYTKIVATEDYITQKKVTFWDIPTIVEGARAKMRVDRDTMRWRVLDDRIKAAAQAKKEAKETKEAIGAVAMVLGLLAALPSAGASVAAVAGGASTAIGVGMLPSSIQDYILQSATSGTDFDRARAISQEEPSLFWLAFEIVGTAHGAIASFRALAGLRRAALIGETGATNAMRSQGNHLGKHLGKQLGDRLVREVEALQKSGKAGTKAVAGAGQVVDKEALQAAKLGEAAVHGVEVHEIIVTKTGAFRCSKKCGNIMWLYDDVLNQYPTLKPRLQELIGLGEQGSKPLAAFTQRMDRLREIALMSEEQLQSALKFNPPGSVLGDHLRFEQYRRAGGVASYEEWFVRSKGQIAKGGEVWGELSEELKIGLEGGAKKGLTAAQRQQLLAEARAVDSAESVAGGYREKFASLHPDFPGGKEWQVHHSIPQEYRLTLKAAGINVDSPSFLRGVRTTPGQQSNVHQKITNDWKDWKANFVNSFHRLPTAPEIIERAKLVDWKFGHVYWGAEKAAGIPVPTKP